MQITVLKIGALKEKYFVQCEQDFIKRLKPYAKLKTVSLPAVPLKKSNTLKQVIQQEGKSILKFLEKNPDQFVIALDRTGTEISSEKLAARLGQLKNQGQKITFVIGGPYGLSKPVLSRADLLLSFSQLTFPHALIYLFLLEQLYRSFTILTGKKYHY